MGILATLRSWCRPRSQRQKPRAQEIDDGDTEDLGPFSIPSHPGWTYESHQYLGMIDGRHCYSVLYARGAQRVYVHHRFLASVASKDQRERLEHNFRLHPPRF